MAYPPPPPQPTGYQVVSLERTDEGEFVIIREDGPRPPVRSVDSAILRAITRRAIVVNIALR